MKRISGQGVDPSRRGEPLVLGGLTGARDKSSCASMEEETKGPNQNRFLGWGTGATLRP